VTVPANASSNLTFTAYSLAAAVTTNNISFNFSTPILAPVSGDWWTMGWWSKWTSGTSGLKCQLTMKQGATTWYLTAAGVWQTAPFTPSQNCINANGQRSGTAFALPSGMTSAAATLTVTISRPNTGLVGDTVQVGDFRLEAGTGFTYGPAQSPLILQTLGAALASAATITPITQIVHVTGTTPIATITPPASCLQPGYGCRVLLIPDGLWSTTTGGNIFLGTTAVVGKVLEELYDPVAGKWFPNY